MQKVLSKVNLVAFIAMVSINILANSLPINGYTTGEVSDFYPNLFTPAGFTFAIWGLIYLLLAIWIIGQIRDSVNNRSTSVYTSQVGWLFVITCGLNVAWIFAWHYQALLVSVIIIFALLFTLREIYMRLGRIRSNTGFEEFFYKVPFRIYLAWISVAAIANTTVFLVDQNWNQFGLSNEFWFVTIITIVVLLSMVFLILYNDYTYIVTIIWALIGIASARSEDFGVNDIVLTAPLVAIGFLILAMFVAILSSRRVYGSITTR